MKLLDTFPIISDQVDRVELEQILKLCDDTLAAGIEGDIVELGCYVGTTSLFLQRVNMSRGGKKMLHVYDSFQGLPDKAAQDSSPVGEQFVAGELRAPKGELVRHFKQAGLPLPVIHKGWFADFEPSDMPAVIAFAFLDGDFYESIRDSLRLVGPKLAPGAVVIVDDYQSEALPGAKRAVDEWLAIHRVRLQSVASLAILRL
jgi:O-methyltransferase